MGSAHSVSLQIYVFPFTCFAFSLFFCHFVFSSPSLPPSRAPHCAASSRSVSPDWRGRDRSSVSVAGKGLAPRSMWPLTGFACNLLTRISTTERRVGEGRFFFISPPLSSFPLILYLLGGVRSHCVQLHKRGIGALCAVFRRHIGLPAPPRKEPAWAASGGLRYGKKMWVQMHGNGALFAPPPPVRPRERSPSRVVEPCRRRAREGTDSARRERDECRAKT